MEYYSAIRNEILSSEGKGIELETIMLSEISQSKEVKHQVISLICRNKRKMI